MGGLGYEGKRQVRGVIFYKDLKPANVPWDKVKSIIRFYGPDLQQAYLPLDEEIMGELITYLEETIAKERNTFGWPTGIYREAFPELSEEETGLQETQEVDMDFEDEEEEWGRTA